MLELAESFQNQARSVKPFPEVEETRQLVQHETEDFSKKQFSGSVASETLENKIPTRDLTENRDSVKKLESNAQTKQIPKTQEPRIAEKTDCGRCDESGFPAPLHGNPRKRESG